MTKAASAATSITATKIQSAVELKDELVKRGSIDELAAAMIEFGRRPPLDMPARLDIHHRVAEQFSLERAARELSKFYQGLKPAL